MEESLLYCDLYFPIFSKNTKINDKSKPSKRNSHLLSVYYLFFQNNP